MATVLDVVTGAVEQKQPGVGAAAGGSKRKKQTLGDRLLQRGVLEGVVGLGRRAATRGPPPAGKESESLLLLLDGVRKWMHECNVVGERDGAGQFIAEAQAVGGQKDLKYRVSELREMEFRGVIDDDWEPIEVRRRRKKKLEASEAKQAHKSEENGEDEDAAENGTANAAETAGDANFAATHGGVHTPGEPAGETAEQRANRNRLAALARLQETKARRAAAGAGSAAPDERSAAEHRSEAPPPPVPSANAAAPVPQQQAPVVVQGEDEVDMYDIMEAEMAAAGEDLNENDAEMEVLAEIGFEEG